MKNLRIPIFFFSGTGNTWWVSKRMCETLNKYGCEASIHSIEQVSDAQITDLINNADLVGFGFPIYGSDVPRIFHDFLRKLPVLNEEKTALGFVTQMAWSGDGINFLAPELLRKGYRLKWAAEFNMPNNIALPIFPLPYSSDDKKVAPQLEKCTVKIQTFCEKVAQNTPYRQHSDPFSATAAWVQRGPFRLVHDIGRKYWSVDAEACISCNRCANICPTGNITMLDGLPYYAEKCTYCMRCFNYCPTFAIHYLGMKNTRVEKERPFQGPIPAFKPELLTEK